MLINTFRHLKGIGLKREFDLWRSGIISWEDFEADNNKQVPLLEKIEYGFDHSLLYSSREALKNGDVDFFATRLPKHEYYRIALTYPEKTLFLDIETTGLSRYYDDITLVGWSFGNEYCVFIQGGKDKALRQALSNAKVIVTFNGSIFDIPFLLKEFPNLHIPPCHVDLRFFSRRVGLSGGQKDIEQSIGVKRPKKISDVKGETAALLWFQYRWGDLSALKQLIMYNHADIEGMKIIIDNVIERLLQTENYPIKTQSITRFSKSRSKIKWNNVGEHNSEGIRILPYKEKSKNIFTLKDLNLSLNTTGLKVVGIDLTGSEARSSGWCLLKGCHAITKRLNTDAEIFNETIATQPTLVSIDSPLSLPEGRKSVEDDDPGRDTYGIMRHCERVLKKRGVNVYPSLIPSMQRLTARGIRMAQHFHGLGIPVIESYPGAAQDIMGIPRKRASLELLAKGLEKFGLLGDFISTAVSHDELDAITSAIVGLFFWSGKFEAIGNTKEEYLIIPDLKNDPNPWMKRKVIGFSGPIASGKTTASNYLKHTGFSYVGFSIVLEKLLQDNGLPISRQSLQKIGEEVNKNRGQRWLCRELVQTIPHQGNIVIDGLRHPDDHAFLVETFGPAFTHVYIDVPNDVLSKRYVDGGNTYEDFKKAISHPVESNVSKLRSLAHFVIFNNESIKSFEDKINSTFLK